MSYRSNLGAVRGALQRGIDAGLVAVGAHYVAAVRARLVRGYTTGNFSHQMRGVAGRVMHTPPYDVPGGRAITLGTGPTVTPYELYWELGHQNQFTKRYERVRIWEPTLETHAGLYERMIARNVERQLAGASALLAFSFGRPR